MSLVLVEQDGGVAFAVKVVPGSKQQRIVGNYGDALKLAVTAPPEQGKANAAVRELLAAQLGIDQRRVDITAGGSSRNKRVFIAGITAAALRQRLGVD